MEGIFAYEHPFVCTDGVVFTIQTQEANSYRKLPKAQLHILLYRRKENPYAGTWCLPGGFLSIDEMPENNIRRKISEKSQVCPCYLEQLYTVCDLQRDPRARVISIVYLGIMNETSAQSQQFDVDSNWFAIRVNDDGSVLFQNETEKITREDFGFDHYVMIQTALERLRVKLLYSDIIFYLLPDCFTLTQFQNVYETITEKKEQAANFRRRMIHLLEETGAYTTDKGHRPAKLYRKKGC